MQEYEIDSSYEETDDGRRVRLSPSSRIRYVNSILKFRKPSTSCCKRRRRETDTTSGCEVVTCPLKWLCVSVIAPFLVAGIIIGIFVLVAANKLGTALETAEAMAESYASSWFGPSLVKMDVRAGAASFVNSLTDPVPKFNDPMLQGWLGRRGKDQIEWNITSRPPLDSLNRLVIISRNVFSGNLTLIDKFPICESAKLATHKCSEMEKLCTTIISPTIPEGEQLFIALAYVRPDNQGYQVKTSTPLNLK